MGALILRTEVFWGLLYYRCARTQPPKKMGSGSGFAVQGSRALGLPGSRPSGLQGFRAFEAYRASGL